MSGDKRRQKVGMKDIIESLKRLLFYIAEDGPRSEIVRKSWITRHAHGEGRAHRDRGFQDRYGTTNIAKLSSEPSLNIRRGMSVITRLARKQCGFEPKAMYRKGLGWIGVYAGVSGNPNNDYCGGHGIAHILSKHAEYEGITARTIAETLQNGEMFRNYDPSSEVERSRKITMIQGNNVAIVSKHRDGRILITDFNVVKGNDQHSIDEKLRQYKRAGRYCVRGENK